jgi:hypothetical protein
MRNERRKTKHKSRKTVENLGKSEALVVLVNLFENRILVQLFFFYLPYGFNVHTGAFGDTYTNLCLPSWICYFFQF